MTEKDWDALDRAAPENTENPADSDDVDAIIRSVLDEIERSDEEMNGASGQDGEATRVVPDVSGASHAGSAPAMDQTQAFRPVQEPPKAEPQKPEKEKKQKKAQPVKQKKRRLRPAQRALIYVFGVVTAAVVLAIAAWYCALDVLALTKPDRQVTVTVSETDTISDVTDTLYRNGLIEYKWLFRLYCAFAHAEQKIDPGVYTLNNLFDYHALVNGLIGTAETRDTVKVTVPEGYESEQIFRLLEEKGVCSYDDLADAAANHEFDYDFLSGLAYGQANRLEGYLFPDTYEFYLNDGADAVLKKFLNNFRSKFTEQMQADIDTLNAALRAKMEAEGFTEERIQENLMDLGKIVIVASLIEKETAGASESANIASVIYNRLCSDVYPCLQIDATIQYVLAERKQTLTAEDLAIDSPYNTYTNPGLTPGPIANPGLDSLNAALHPAETTYFFYALDKNGKHHFSSTYYEHQAFLEGLKE